MRRFLFFCFISIAFNAHCNVLHGQKDTSLYFIISVDGRVQTKVEDLRIVVFYSDSTQNVIRPEYCPGRLSFSNYDYTKLCTNNSDSLHIEFNFIGKSINKSAKKAFTYNSITLKPQSIVRHLLYEECRPFIYLEVFNIGRRATIHLHKEVPRHYHHSFIRNCFSIFSNSQLFPMIIISYPFPVY